MKKCQEWLQKNHKDLYEQIWSPGTRIPPLCFGPASPNPHTKGNTLTFPTPNSQKP